MLTDISNALMVVGSD